MIIAHRCNINGPSDTENTQEAMLQCIGHGLAVEIDLWFTGGVFYMGHDGPAEEVDISVLLEHDENLFIHCKNIDALYQLKAYNNLNVFGHSNDEFVLTSQGDIFCSVGVAQKGCICVMPELYSPNFSDAELQCCKHILTDYPFRYVIDETNNNPFR